MDEAEVAAREWARGALPEADFQNLLTFIGLCESWGAVSNLVSRADRERLWSRHVADSLQLIDAASGLGRRWIDLGSGAGFPGLVVAIGRAETDMVLVESNKKKAAFLLRAAALADGRVHVEPRRAEDLPARPYDVVSARALAPLHKLFPLCERFFGGETVGLFPKGKDAASEIEMARKQFRFDLETRPSRTDPGGVILTVANLVRV